MTNDLLKHFVDCRDPYAFLFIPKNNLGQKAFYFSSSTAIKPEELEKHIISKNSILFGFFSFEQVPHFYKATDKSFLQEDASLTRDFINNKIKNLKTRLNVTSINNQESFTDWQKMLAVAKKIFLNFKDLKKIVLHRKITISLKEKISTDQIICTLPEITDQHHFFIFKNHQEIVVSYTPETLCRYSHDQLTTISLAGTAPRDLNNQALDQKFSDDLLQDDKNLREQNFVTERIVKDLSPFTTNIEIGPLYILKQTYVQHLAQNIKAHINREKIWGLIQTMHPTPALGGEPQKLALEQIRMIEQTPRQEYGGAFGFILPDEIQLVVNIRCLKFEHENKSITLFGGCGILMESDPQLEWLETENKMRHFLKHFEKFKIAEMSKLDDDKK